uniref:cytochrome c oxidase subunit II n=1 Tax=Barbatia decussata TaxID=1508519 RepID=UPI002028898C|nr:cytochrome c oxidase subunit II [Barbatia decussata]UQT66000.1 cytochrome c oxidase subunit 2 [Barbatia decussata]
MAYSGQTRLHEMMGPASKGVYYLMDHAISGCVLVGLVVLMSLIFILYSKMISLYSWEGHKLEVIWTVVPAVILGVMAVPSLYLLYAMGQFSSMKLDLKVTGHQWYWSYEYGSNKKLSFSSYMKGADDLNIGEFRMFEVNNRTVLPFGVGIRALVTSSDVLHSWAVPALGVKMDAVPGRVNGVPFFISYPGVYYGQCSELCGAYHSQMPIVIEAVGADEFFNVV